MSFTYKTKVPTPDQIKQEISLPPKVAAIKAERDAQIRAVFTGESSRFVVIIGPCSAHDPDAVCEYVSRLGKLAEETAEKLLIIPRIYTNKPRTLGVGYKGMLHQPDLSREENIVAGLRSLRHMHIRSILESGLTAADEMLYPGNHPYLDDLLSYVAVGARSVENQQHRLTASGIDIPVGMKNPPSGDLRVMLNSIEAAAAAHVFTYNGWQVETSGNPLAHAILRGAVDSHGTAIPNYHYEDLQEVQELFAERKLPCPTCIVDTNHANSGKQHAAQPRIAAEIMHTRSINPGLRELIRGIMVESFLVDGRGESDTANYGQSITDPCLGWDATRNLLRDLAEKV